MKNSRERVHEYTAFFEANEPGGYPVTVSALPALSLKGRTSNTRVTWQKMPSAVYIEGLKSRFLLNQSLLSSDFLLLRKPIYPYQPRSWFCIPLGYTKVQLFPRHRIASNPTPCNCGVLASY
jgi:hypothetical protein